MKKNGTKRSLIMSLLSMVLCMSMLIGSTFAWFTDEVTSTGNIIKSGTLEVEMKWADGKEDPNNVTTWTDASTGAIFKYDLWEPGYTEVRHIKIENTGSLALKYQVKIMANGEVSDLSDVIDVYYMDPAQQVSSRTDLVNVPKLGVLTDVLANVETTAEGTLLAKEEQTLTLALKMQETAGNEYQNKSIGTDFSVVLTATQLTYEKDSYDNNYDEDSEMPVVVTTVSELSEALSNGENVVLGANLEVDSDTTVAVPKGKTSKLDLNGKTITAETDSTGSNRNVFAVKGELTVENGNILYEHQGENMGWSSSTNVFDVTDGGVLNIKNATIENKGGSDMGFVIHLNNWGEVTLNVENSTLISNYVAVRVFNSGNDMNNVTIKNSTLQGASAAFWVHNYTVDDFGTQDKVAIQKALLNFDISDNSNTFIGNSEKQGPIRLGFTNSKYVSAEGLKSELSN